MFHMPCYVTCNVRTALIANILTFNHRIMVNRLILRIVMRNCGLGNPVMSVLRLASSATIAQPTVGAGVSTTTGTAVAATGFGFGRARTRAKPRRGMSVHFAGCHVALVFRRGVPVA